jgi:chloramphenicol 3-O-phosphotransferase
MEVCDAITSFDYGTVISTRNKLVRCFDSLTGTPALSIGVKCRHYSRQRRSSTAAQYGAVNMLFSWLNTGNAEVLCSFLSHCQRTVP